MSLDVVSLGEPMSELCATSTGHLREVAGFKLGWGGDTSNFAVAVARLGRKVGYMCRLGDDEFGKSFLELWAREGVDASRVIVEKGAFTGVYFISLIDGGEHDFTYYRKDSAASRFSPEDIDEAYVKQAKVFHSSGISLAISQSLREAVFEAAKLVKDAGGLFSFDPNVRLRLWPVNTARAIVSYACTQANIVITSIEDMKLLYGYEEPEKAASALHSMGPEKVVVKLGAEGCLVSADGESFRSPGFKVKVVDTTGAGDAFDGAFIMGMLEGWDYRRIARFSNAVGALTAMDRGAVAPIPTRRQVEKFLRSQGVRL
ncbi:MAG: sugar kinase [Candidatus Bathyarchaeia archaeon]